MNFTMKLKVFLFCVFFAQLLSAQSYQNIHKKAILVDTHNDILSQVMNKGVLFDTDLKGKTHSDLARWKQGGLDVQFFSVFCDGKQVNPYNFAMRQMDSLDAVVKRNPDKIVWIHLFAITKYRKELHVQAALFPSRQIAVGFTF